VEQAITQSNSDYEELQRLLERQSQIEAGLSEKTDRWLYLNDLADRIAQEAE